VKAKGLSAQEAAQLAGKVVGKVSGLASGKGPSGASSLTSTKAKSVAAAAGGAERGVSAKGKTAPSKLSSLGKPQASPAQPHQSQESRKGPAKAKPGDAKAQIGAGRKREMDPADDDAGLLDDEFGDENSETLGLDFAEENEDGTEDHESHGPPAVHTEPDDGGPDSEEVPPNPATLVQRQVTSSGSSRRRPKDSFQFDRDGDLVAQWQVFFDKNKGIKPLTYKMTESYPARVPLQHKVLGWGFVISNLNDRLEVLFQSGLRTLISNYKG
jgi:hypothetical protein